METSGKLADSPLPTLLHQLFAAQATGMVRIVSRRGDVTARTKVTADSPPGVVSMTFHFAEAAANLLTIDAVDPTAKIPEYKVCAVQVEGVGNNFEQEQSIAASERS